MNEILKNYPNIKKNILKTMNILNIKPLEISVRGGTDGSILSYRGLPCPNIFAGGLNFHSTSEYVSVQDMILVVKYLIYFSISYE